MVSTLDQEYMDCRIKLLIDGVGGKSSDDSEMNENLSDSQFLQEIEEDLNSQDQLGKSPNTILASIISETWEEPPPKDILPKKPEAYETPNNSKTSTGQKSKLTGTIVYTKTQADRSQGPTQSIMYKCINKLFLIWLMSL